MSKRFPEHQIDEKTLQYKQTQKPQEDDAVRQMITVSKEDENQINPSKQPQEKKEENQKQPQKKEGVLPTGGLFSSQFNHEPIITGKPLFPGLSTTNIKNLFNNTPAATTANATPAPITNLPATTVAPASTSLFGGSSLFGKTSSLGSNNLFSQNASIFGFNITVPPIKQGEEDGDNDGDSQELERAQDMKIDKEKSKGKYEYSSECEVLKAARLNKYRKNKGDLVQGLEFILQYDPVKHQHYVLVRLVATKHPILTGIVIIGYTTVNTVRVLNKENNLQITLGEIEQKKINRCAIKIQFQREEDGKEVKGLIQKILSEGTPKQHTAKQPAKKQQSTPKQVGTTPKQESTPKQEKTAKKDHKTPQDKDKQQNQDSKKSSQYAKKSSK